MVSQGRNTCMLLPVLPLGFGLATAEIFITQPDKKELYSFNMVIQFNSVLLAQEGNSMCLHAMYHKDETRR